MLTFPPEADLVPFWGRLTVKKIRRNLTCPTLWEGSDLDHILTQGSVRTGAGERNQQVCAAAAVRFLLKEKVSEMVPCPSARSSKDNQEEGSSKGRSRVTKCSGGGDGGALWRRIQLKKQLCELFFSLFPPTPLQASREATGLALLQTATEMLWVWWQLMF